MTVRKVIRNFADLRYDGAMLRVLGLVGFLAAPLSAGERCTEDAMIVFDGSGSMSGIGAGVFGTPRIAEARAAMQAVLPEVAQLRRLGLVVYGPDGDRTCRNISLRFGPQWQAAPRIQAEVDALRPAGGTPLTKAVKLAAEVLDYRKQPGTIVLVTDGQETCQGAPCALAEELARFAPELTVHVIGYKLADERLDRNEPEPLARSPSAQCLADATGGHYVNARDAHDLVQALRTTLGCNQFSRGEGLRGPRGRTLPSAG